MAPTVATPGAIEKALGQDFQGITPERKEQILVTVRAANAATKPAAIRADLHKIFTENLTPGELAFYQAIIVMPPPDPAAAGPSAEPQPPASSPEAAATAVTADADAARSESARSRSR